MTWINHYLASEYRDGARGECINGIYYYDCWGMTREVRYLHLLKRLLPSWGDVRNTNPREFTRAYREESENMEECDPEVGAIASVFRGKLCIHVAVIIEIDSRLAVLEINQSTGARWRWLHEWQAEHAHTRVTYHRDRSLSK